MKVRCVSKNRDQKGRIVNYTLQFEDGRVIQATTKEIKNEMSVGRYQFTNLQIDKAGRLVDKAEEKQQEQSKQKPVAADGDFYTIEDLIRGVDPKGRKVRCYNKNIGKYVVGEGVELYSTNKEVGNTILVYIEELNSNMKTGLIPLKDFDRFWAKYKEEFPYINKNMQDLNYYGKCTKPDEETFQRILEFCKQSVDEFDLKFGFGKVGNKVDAKPNPTGRYTVVAIGKPEAKNLYKVRDNKEGREYWKYINSLDFNPDYNDFTNVVIERNVRKFAKNTPVVEVEELLQKKDACIDKIKQEIRKNLPQGVTVNEDEVMVADFKAFDETCKKVEKLWHTLELEDSFKDMLFSAVDAVLECEEHPQTLYYGFLGDAGGGIMSEISYSYNPEDVRSCLKSLIDRYMECMEDCSEIEAKRSAYDLIRTNIQHDFYINDDEEDDEWD